MKRLLRRILRSWLRRWLWKRDRIRFDRIRFDRTVDPHAPCLCGHIKSNHYDYVEQDLGPGWGKRFRGCLECEDRAYWARCTGFVEAMQRDTEMWLP